MIYIDPELDAAQVAQILPRLRGEHVDRYTMNATNRFARAIRVSTGTEEIYWLFNEENLLIEAVVEWRPQLAKILAEYKELTK